MLTLTQRALNISDPSGTEELLLLEQHEGPRETMLAVARRLITDQWRQPIEWDDLPAVELDALALLLRRSWLGDLVHAVATCRTADCAQPIDVQFTVGAYLNHHQPRRPQSARALTDGWWLLSDTTVRFRVPTIADIRAMSATEDPAGEWRRRCLDAGDEGGDMDGRTMRRLDVALDALAPPLAGELVGTCPNCGAATTLFFDPLSFVTTELAARARGLYREIQIIASAFGWSESEILHLPRRRRGAYASTISEHREIAS